MVLAVVSQVHPVMQMVQRALLIQVVVAALLAALTLTLAVLAVQAS